MSKKYFLEIFFGAALGIILYRFLLRIEDLNDIAEVNLLLKISIMAFFAFVGIMLIRQLSRYLFPAGKEKPGSQK